MMAYTLFNYLYRDAANYKAFGTVALEGALANDQLDLVRSVFRGDGLFIAEQIRVPTLYGELYQWSNGPTNADHCWHEFVDVQVVGEGDVPEKAYHYGSAGEFLAQLFSAGEWNEELSPHFRLVLRRAG
jgi:hypothetical protein